jgi:UDP-N-acetylmuramoyl-L-alanyl-D-glutamate--2,6-diaminopimelate ligase
MDIKKLVAGIPGIEIKGSPTIKITGLCNNSKSVAPGNLFFAKKGLTSKGGDFMKEAAQNGAVAIATDLFDPFLKGPTQIIYPDIAELEVILSDRFYGKPFEKLLSVGITGTNGKTTTSYLVKYLLDSLGKETGLIGTIEWIVKNSVFPSKQTTPDLLMNQKLWHEMVGSGCKAVVMEVSSHGLDQGRVRGVHFNRAIFTNLTQDHLDYHETMERYGEAKKQLFTSLDSSGYAILNKDSPWSEFMREGILAPSLTYGFSSEADVRAEELVLSSKGSSCVISYKNEKLPFLSKLVGKFNVYNLLSVIALGVSLDYPLSQILSVLSSFTAVDGRLEKVETVSGKNIFVDYAHTEDALKNTLLTLREVSEEGRIFCVFGCGGNRDRSKRPKMGAVAEALADKVFITSDNPRSEVPEEIIEEILEGITNREKICVEIDRRKAIALACAMLTPSDVLLIAGKGHERVQIFSDHIVHFDDRIVAKEYSEYSI